MLAGWHGWGSFPGVFDDRRDRTAGERAAREQIERAAQRWPGYLETARRTTLNAHYTDPAIVSEVWRFLREVGVDDGQVGWEPGAGTGLWMGDPAAVRLHGVELDPVSAAIGNYLAPSGSRIDNVNLTAARLPGDGPGSVGYDVVVGNVPFASVSPHAADNPLGLSLHNYALVKSARMCRPGGYVVLLTSRHTLDSSTSTTRDELARWTNLVGAVRLPTDAHARRAGTAVVTDLLVMHRPTSADLLVGWPHPVLVDVDGAAIGVSSHFVEHPERVLGSFALGGMRNVEDLRVLHPAARDGAYLSGLAGQLDEISVAAPRATPEGSAPAVTDRTQVRAGELPLGSIVQRGDRFERLTSTGPVEHKAPKTQAAELSALCGLRDAVRDVLAADGAGADAVELRRTLSGRYERYVASWGPLNRFGEGTVTRAVLGPDEGAEESLPTRRVYPRMGSFRADPGWWTVAALEVFDDDTQTAVPAPIMRGPVARSADYPERVDDPATAVRIMAARDGAVTVEAAAALGGVDVDVAEAWLGDHVYRDPGAGGELVPAAVYLSGLVREKFDVARAAAESEPSLSRNVAALEAVLPRWLTAEEITPRIGAPWIPAADVARFVEEELLLRQVQVVHVPAMASWSINAFGYSPENESVFGVHGRRTALELVEDLANQRATKLYRTLPDDRRVLDVEATAAAAGKRAELEDRFAGWVWSDQERTERLVDVYNRRYNGYVEPRWDGSALQLDGLSSTFAPRPHQLDAVARVLGDRDRGTLLAHTVGAGKTAVMAMSAMELRRLGISGGPVGVVVPNSMLQQFAREFLQLYPQANLLVADDVNFAKDRRREFAARAASGAYDVVLFTHTSFTAVPPSPATIEAATAREVETYRAALASVGPDDGQASRRAVKQIETAIANLEARLEKAADRANYDEGTVGFEQLGLGHLMVDEAHLAKNLSFPTRIDAVQVRESGRARDLLIKVDWMRERCGLGAVTMATATPVTNQLSEMWVFQRFLDPVGLARSGAEHFDAWAANFAKTVTTVEIAPSGSGFRTATRFAQFTNVPELARAFRAFGDVRTAEQLQLPRPQIRGGKPETISVDGGPRLAAFMEDLVRRSDAAKSNRNPEPGDDNVLSIASDGRVGALDMRLANRSGHFAPPGSGPGPKVERAAVEITRRYHDNADRVFLDDAGRPHPIRGAAQIVFIDHGVPGNPHHDCYADLTAALVERGVPRERIAAVQTAKTHGDRANLFRSVREGRIAVLIGSTESMGVGVNVQTRLIASHIVTPPWRPDQVEQAEGRILRQGNQCGEVELLRYVTEGSYDAYSWQTIERKARFIGQVMTAPEALGRDLSDEAAVADDYAVLKAIATGDPRILAAAQLEAKVTALDRARAVHERTMNSLAGQLRTAKAHVASNTVTLSRLRRLVEQRRPGADVELHQSSGSRDVFEAGAGAGERIGDCLIGWAKSHDRERTVTIGAIEGVPMELRISHRVVRLTPEGVDHPHVDRTWDVTELRYGRNAAPHGVGQAALNLVRSIPERTGEIAGVLDEQQRRAAAIESRLGDVFPHEVELQQLRGELAALQDELMNDASSSDVPLPARRSTLEPPIEHLHAPVQPGQGIER